jgi:hypothetical protein
VPPVALPRPGGGLSNNPPAAPKSGGGPEAGGFRQPTPELTAGTPPPNAQPGKFSNYSPKVPKSGVEPERHRVEKGC